MDVPTLARSAAAKGLGLLGTGDAQHPRWLDHLRAELVEEGDGLYRARSAPRGPLFVAQTELEDLDMVHHLVLLPSLDAARELGERVAATGANVSSNARPHVRLDGAGVADVVRDVGGLLGPAHAFTPHRSLLREGGFGSLEGCYRERARDVRFLELGLSADTDMADAISSLHRLTFLSSSDAHGPQPHRLGREFTRLRLAEQSFPALRRALERGDAELNVGLDPRLGKYHLSWCASCGRLFGDGLPAGRRCPCGGEARPGVRDRVRALADLPAGRHPPGRPPYLRIVPLAELVALALGVRGIASKGVASVWSRLVGAAGSETRALVDLPLDEAARAAPGPVVEWLGAFREGRLEVEPGGGGRYGRARLH